MNRTPQRPFAALFGAVILLALAGRGHAQGITDSLVDRPLATREALTTLATQLGTGQNVGALTARIRARLTDGDFRPGDRVLLVVQGESTLTDTFAVGPDRALLFPQPAVGSLSLNGVLRSELEAHVAAFVSQFVLNAVIRARPLLRVSVQGEVGRPGFHGVPADGVLSEALTAAGGTTPMAELRKARIERDGEPILQGDALQRAFASGSTLDDVRVRDGDQVIVPRRRESSGFRDNLNFIWVLVSITGGIYGLTRVF